MDNEKLKEICDKYKIEMVDDNIIKSLNEFYHKLNNVNFPNVQINPDTKIYDALLGGLFKKKLKFGNFYCPCKIVNEARNICPCEDMIKEVAENGKCHCGMFIKREKKNE